MLQFSSNSFLQRSPWRVRASWMALMRHHTSPRSSSSMVCGLMKFCCISASHHGFTWRQRSFVASHRRPGLSTGMTRQCSKKEPIESDILDEEEVASEQMVQTLEDGINEEPLIEQSSSNVASNVDSSILGIALPTLATLAADPLASLISTAWVGQLGAVELAGVGVAISVYNTLTKVLNMPLLAVVTSNTATALGVSGSEGERSSKVGAAIGTTLMLSTSIGLLQMALLVFGGLPGLALWGAGEHSPLRSSAAAYLILRAVSAPLSVALLALQGIFRGLGDTEAPLLATILSNLVNVILEPLFIFQLGWGVQGAAGAISVAQFVSLGALLLLLRQRGIRVQSSSFASLNDVWEYLKPTGLLVLRTMSITATYAVATGIATRTDPSHAAAHQIAFQIWLAASLLADSLAVAAQSLIARSLAEESAARRAEARVVVDRVINLSLGLGIALAAGLAAGTMVLPLPRLFSNDINVVKVLDYLIPVVIFTQPINALAFALDGVLYGVNGFKYAAVSMLMAAVPAIGVMFLGSRMAVELGFGLQGQLFAAWSGLAVVMTLRFVTIAKPLVEGQAPFDKLRK